jgi:CheY-like chemotaxis protein
MDSNVPQFLIGDAHRLNQVLLNIINNSIKFTDKGEIKIVIRKNSQTDHGISLTFDVIDSGIGMSDEQQKDIFAPFLQGDNSTTRKYGGTGLGLSISKGIVELMGGHISVNSKIDVGSTFSFTADFGWHDQINDEIEQNKALDYLEVLLVSSNNNMQAIFEKEFSLLGISIDTCTGLNEAIRCLQSKSNYHVILLDREILNKHTAMEQIKAMIVKPMLKVMVISTSRDYDIEMLEHVDIINTIIYNPIGMRQLYQKLGKIFSDIKTLEKDSLNKDFTINQAHILKDVKLLLVEDNELNRELAIAILEEYGLIIDSAENGSIAIEKLLKEPYDLVLMDLQMPVMDGYEATKRIREIDSLKKMPIIAMSAHAIKGLEEIVYETGMNDYITKPFEVSKMISTLEFWAGKHE